MHQKCQYFEVHQPYKSSRSQMYFKIGVFLKISQYSPDNICAVLEPLFNKVADLKVYQTYICLKFMSEIYMSEIYV